MRSQVVCRALSAALVVVGLSACTTGETEVDARTEAVRQIVRDAGVTRDVASCIVDELEATIGLEVLDDAGTSDELALQLNEITTACLLDEPSDGSPTSSTAPTPTAVPATPPSTVAGSATTVIGPPRP